MLRPDNGSVELPCWRPGAWRRMWRWIPFAFFVRRLHFDVVPCVSISRHSCSSYRCSYSKWEPLFARLFGDPWGQLRETQQENLEFRVMEPLSVYNPVGTMDTVRFWDHQATLSKAKFILLGPKRGYKSPAFDSSWLPIFLFWISALRGHLPLPNPRGQNLPTGS